MVALTFPDGARREFPDNITGNTNAASVLTGWKGAELVLEDQK